MTYEYFLFFFRDFGLLVTHFNFNFKGKFERYKIYRITGNAIITYMFVTI